MSAKSRSGRTPLLLAARDNNSLEVSKLFIKHMLSKNFNTEMPQIINDNVELLNYWNECKAKAVKLHDIVGDNIDLTNGDISIRPVMRMLSEFLDHNSRKNLVKASLESALDANVPDDRGYQASNGLPGNSSQSIVNGATQQQQAETPEEDDPQPAKQQPTNGFTKQLLNLSPREVAVISIATISCALALYFLAPLILGATVGLVTQLALGAAGAVLGSGVGYLTNIVIDKFCGNEVAEQIV